VSFFAPITLELAAVVLLMAALLLLPAIAALLLECLAALLPPRRCEFPPEMPRPTVAVLVPAHNEASGITATLEAILPQLTEGDRLLVVADNCEDETAAIARAAGATVIERWDTECRGKGYALDYGMQWLSRQPPQIVIMVDADCHLTSGSVEQLARVAEMSGRPVQSTYLFTLPVNHQPRDFVSLLAITVKNVVRPLGLAWFDLPCPLTGTGMAFPWQVLQSATLATGNIVEDMNLGVELAIAGFPPLFCASALVTSVLPGQRHAAKSQRTRWVHGHLQTLVTQVPRLLQAFLRKGRWELLFLAVDLAIPPLSLLAMLWGAVTLGSLLASFLGVSTLPLSLLLIQGVFLAIAIFSAWFKFCRSVIPLKFFLFVPLYIAWKVPLYLAFLVKRQTQWVRTERDSVS